MGKDDSPGSLFRGAQISYYKILDKLGSGGMGEVYLAEDTKLDRRVALKFLPIHLSSDEALKTRFINEARAAARLNHPNIVTIFEVNDYDGRPFFVMEYVEGKPLSEIIGSEGLPYDQAVDITLQICEGLKEAHNARIVHRDIKPSNIIIEENGRCRILDFGLAAIQSEERLTRTDSLLGTVEYMSPEQVGNKKADHRTDIFSLGVLFYEMLTGRLPFKGEYFAGIVYSIINEVPEMLDKYRTDISRGFQIIIDRALEKDPETRYQRIGDLMTDLKKWQSGQVLERSPGHYPSIAVLPFRDMSEQKDQEYFCDGMSEEIINALTRIDNLNVVARTSAFSFKGKDIDIREIGRKLSVSALLEGSVRKAKNRLRITTQLINVSDGYHIWSESYDCETKDIFDVQSGIAKNIAAVLKVKLSPQEKEQVEKKPTDSFTAYDYYIRGREYYNRYRKQDNDNAIKLFKKAAKFDPRYGQTYAGLMDAYAMRSRFGYGYKWIDLAIEVGRKAISIDPDCADVHKALGLAYEWKGLFGKALKSYFKTIDLNPKHFSATLNIADTYLSIGQYDIALQWIKKAIALNPKHSMLTWTIGEIHTGLDDYAKAEFWFNKALDLDPDFISEHNYFIEMYLVQGKYDQVKTYCRKVLLNSPDSVYALHGAGWVELFSGNYAQAKQYYKKAMKIPSLEMNEIIPFAGLTYILRKTDQQQESKQMFIQCFALANRLLEAGNECWQIPYHIAAINAIDGNKEAAYLWLQKAINAGWRNYRIGSIDPFFENLREDDRFKRILCEAKAMVDDMRKRVEQNDRRENISISNPR